MSSSSSSSSSISSSSSSSISSAAAGGGGWVGGFLHSEGDLAVVDVLEGEGEAAGGGLGNRRRSAFLGVGGWVGGWVGWRRTRRLE